MREEVFGGRECGAVVVERVEPGLRDAHARGHRGVGREERDARGPERDEVAVPRVALVEALEGAGHLHVAAVEREEPFEVADRALGLIGEVLGDVRGLVEERGAALAIVFAHALDGAVVEREEVVPSLGDREEHREAFEGPRRGGVCREGSLEEEHEAVGVGGPLVVKGDGAEPQRAQHLGRQRSREHVEVQRLDLFGPLEVAGLGLGGVPASVVSWGLGGFAKAFLERLVRGHSYWCLEARVEGRLSPHNDRRFGAQDNANLRGAYTGT